MNRSLSIFVLALALCATACNTPSRVAEHIGEAHHDAIARMTADPDAVYRNIDAPSGLDPLTAEKVVEKYEKKQGKTEKAGSQPSIIQISGSRR